ncbi:MAG: amidase family protein [Reyranella sp.]
MTELLDRGAAAIAAAVRTGKTSARDVAEAAIARVEARNEALTAIVDFDPAEGRAAADAVDSRRKQGFDGPILGVPCTVKDTTWSKAAGSPTARCCGRISSRPAMPSRSSGCGTRVVSSSA